MSLRAKTERARALYADGMQRLYSMFAGGAAGAALLILRTCAGSSLLILESAHGHFASPSWTALGVGAIVLMLGVGVLTPIACAIGGLIEAYYIFHASGTDEWQAVFALALFLALALLGPGAFSIDAKLFGRRLIVPGED
jgi:uncharacterized membrane protein YphA (DoxX/SURF4 family)